MAYKQLPWGPEVGRVWLPDASISYPSGQVKPKYTGIVAHKQSRMVGIEKGILPVAPDDSSKEALAAFYAPYRMEYDPALFETCTIQVGVNHNQRTILGGKLQQHLLFGITNSTAAGVLTRIGISGSSTFTAAAADISLFTTAANSVANELTSSGWSTPGRLTGTAAVSAEQTGLDTTFTCTITGAWTSGGTVTATGAGLFDSTSTSTFKLFAEATFSSATMIANDVLQVTWTVVN